MSDTPILRLVSAGASPCVACDWYLVEYVGLEAEEWAEIRDVTLRAVVSNLDTAEEVLDE